MRGSRNFRQGVKVLKTCLVINVFRRGTYGPASRSKGTQRVQFLLEGVPYHHFEGNIATCDFPARPLHPPLGSAHVLLDLFKINYRQFCLFELMFCVTVYMYRHVGTYPGLNQYYLTFRLL